MEQKNPIQVAGRLFGVLEFLADAGSAGLMEVSAALDLNKTTAGICEAEYCERQI